MIAMRSLTFSHSIINMIINYHAKDYQLIDVGEPNYSNELEVFLSLTIFIEMCSFE